MVLQLSSKSTLRDSFIYVKNLNLVCVPILSKLLSKNYSIFCCHFATVTNAHKQQTHSWLWHVLLVLKHKFIWLSYMVGWYIAAYKKSSSNTIGTKVNLFYAIKVSLSQAMLLKACSLRRTIIKAFVVNLFLLLWHLYSACQLQCQKKKRLFWCTP